MRSPPISRRDTLRAIAAGAIAAAASLVRAQTVYPNRSIRLVVPYPPGALTDLLARTIAERVSAGLGQPVIIENKPGAGTLVGAEVVAKAVSDGYTLLMATSTTLGISPALYQPSPVNPVRDFAPIGQVGSVNFFLIANPAFPARTVREMIDAIATIALPNLQAGKVVALGTSGAKPTQLVANVPPIAATVPGFDWQAWQGIVAPAGTPKDVIVRLSSELTKLQENADFRAQLVKFGMEPFPPQTPEQFAAVIIAEQPRWVKAIRESGARVD